LQPATKLWGRLPTCGRLSIGLAGDASKLRSVFEPFVWLRLCCSVLLELRIFAACDESKCGAGWKPAADWQSACPGMQTIWERFEPGVWLRLCCSVGQAILPAAGFRAGPIVFSTGAWRSVKYYARTRCSRLPRIPWSNPRLSLEDAVRYECLESASTCNYVLGLHTCN
jgi:hypothetical protein